MFVLGLLFIFEAGEEGIFHILVSNFYVLAAITTIFSVLMVVELPMLSLKAKNFNWKGNEWRYVLIAGAIVLAIILKTQSLAFIIVYYILISINQVVFGEKKDEDIIDSHY